MNKQDLIDAMAQAAGITKTDAESAFNAFTGSVTEQLKNRGKVSIAGFGSFETAQRAARDGINPQTRQPIRIAASTVAKFKPSKVLKEAIKESEG